MTGRSELGCVNMRHPPVTLPPLVVVPPTHPPEEDRGVLQVARHDNRCSATLVARTLHDHIPTTCTERRHLNRNRATY